MRDGCPTEELKFFDKIHPKFRDLVWKDQTEFRGHVRDYRFNTRLIGFENYQEMVLDAAFRIVKHCSMEKRKMLGREMEEILRKRMIVVEKFGGGDTSHRIVIDTWKKAVEIVSKNPHNHMCLPTFCVNDV